MTLYPDDSELSRADGVVERALASVPHPAARAEFLAALRDRFTNVAGAGADRTRAEAGVNVSLPFAGRRTSRGLPRLALAAGILAIAATALAVWAFGPRGTDGWSPVEGHLPSSPVMVDGVSVPPSGLSRCVADGSVAHTIATGAEGLWLRLGERMLFEIAPQSEVELGPLARHGAPLAIATRKGSLRLCTGEEFAGSRLDVATPDFTLVVTGTSFAVDVEGDEGTCVCCLEGPVLIKDPAAADETWKVEGGRMCRIYHDGRAPKWGPLSEKHGAELRRFDEQADALMH